VKKLASPVAKIVATFFYSAINNLSQLVCILKHKANGWRLALSVLLVFSFAAFYLGCESTTPKRPKLDTLSKEEAENLRVSSLRGLKKISLAVFTNNINRERIEKEVALELRKAGITIISDEEAEMEKGFPRLTLGIMQRSIHSSIVYTESELKKIDVFEVSGEFSLSQAVTLERDPSINTLARTWRKDSREITKKESDLSKLEQDVKKELLDDFLNDYLMANPKSGN
jgi:hypothetical protein